MAIAVYKLPGDRAAGLLLILLILVEYHFFRTFASREILWAYPNNHDQAAYLREAYSLWVAFVDRDWAFYIDYIRNPPSTGLLFPMQGALMCLLFGAGRLSCLSLNFLYFTLLQMATFYSIRWISGNAWAGFVGVGLILTQQTAFYWAGGLFDFRIDFTAYCLYGIWALSVVRSRIFEDRKWTVIAGIICAWLVMTRFIAIAYVIGALGLPALYFLGNLFLHRRTPARTTLARARLVNMALFTLTVAALAGPTIYLASESIWAYYGGRHLMGPEKFIRATEMGIRNAMDHLVFYPDSVTYNHLGSIFLGLSASLILAALALATFCRGRRLYDSDNPIPVATSMVFLGACVLAPLIILTIDVSKSPIVGGVVGVPCAVVTVVGLAVLARRAFTTSRVFDIPYYAWAAMAVVSVLVGGWNYFSHLTSRGPFHFRQQEIAQLNQIYDSIARYTETAGWNYPALSMNTVSEAINGDVIVVSHFERTGRLVRIRKLFGHGIFAVSRQKVFEDLPKSDLLILQDLSGESLANHPYPFYASLRGFSDEIRQWADHHLAMLIETPSIYGAGFKVYVRPSMGILELSAGGSIPRKEIWLSGDGRIIRQYPLVILEASEDRSIPPTTKLKAESYTNDGKPVIIPTDFALEGRKRIIRLDFRNAVRFLGPTVMTKLMLDFEDTNYEPRHIAGHAANALLGFNRVRMESPD